MNYVLRSTDPSDAAILARFAPRPTTARLACGLSLDIARHLHGHPRIVTEDGQPGGALIEEEMETLRKIRAGLIVVKG